MKKLLEIKDKTIIANIIFIILSFIGMLFGFFSNHNGIIIFFLIPLLMFSLIFIMFGLPILTKNEKTTKNKRD
jgi:hypothetical protein